LFTLWGSDTIYLTGGPVRTNPGLQGTETARSFLPAKDFALSKSFYESLAFESCAMAMLRYSPSAAVLFSKTTVPRISPGYMMQLMVDNLDLWWKHTEELDLPATFGVASPRPPALQPWGLRVAYFVDPPGVHWHVAERREGNVSDR
jgi:hypothetical protein